MSHDDRDQPVKRTRATQECDPPGITGRVCDGLSWRRSDPSASNPRSQFGAFSHASKNSCIGARRTLACGSGPELHFTLNHYTITDSGVGTRGSSNFASPAPATPRGTCDVPVVSPARARLAVCGPIAQPAAIIARTAVILPKAISTHSAPRRINADSSQNSRKPSFVVNPSHVTGQALMEQRVINLRRSAVNCGVAESPPDRIHGSLAFVTKPAMRRLADQASTVLEAGRLGMAVRPTKPEFGNPLFQ